MKVLITGVAGFIGMHTAQRLLAKGVEVVGIDNLNDYYDVQLKQDRLKQLMPLPGFRFIRMDMADRQASEALFAAEKFQRVVNLAAQPGVRYSLQNPHAYIESNIVGFLNVLEGCRHNQVEH
ncbi:MAG: protein CapI, partial [Nitrosomonadales bacterium]